MGRSAAPAPQGSGRRNPAAPAPPCVRHIRAGTPPQRRAGSPSCPPPSAPRGGGGRIRRATSGPATGVEGNPKRIAWPWSGRCRSWPRRGPWRWVRTGTAFPAVAALKGRGCPRRSAPAHRHSSHPSRCPSPSRHRHWPAGRPHPPRTPPTGSPAPSRSRGRRTGCGRCGRPSGWQTPSACLRSRQPGWPHPRRYRPWRRGPWPGGPAFRPDPR